LNFWKPKNAESCTAWTWEQWIHAIISLDIGQSIARSGSSYPIQKFACEILVSQHNNLIDPSLRNKCDGIDLWEKGKSEVLDPMKQSEPSRLPIIQGSGYLHENSCFVSEL